MGIRAVGVQDPDVALCGAVAGGANDREPRPIRRPRRHVDLRTTWRSEFDRFASGRYVDLEQGVVVAGLRGERDVRAVGGPDRVVIVGTSRQGVRALPRRIRVPNASSGLVSKHDASVLSMLGRMPRSAPAT